jgi:hypothetical protein
VATTRRTGSLERPDPARVRDPLTSFRTSRDLRPIGARAGPPLVGSIRGPTPSRQRPPRVRPGNPATRRRLPFATRLCHYPRGLKGQRLACVEASPVVVHNDSSPEVMWARTPGLNLHE